MGRTTTSGRTCRTLGETPPGRTVLAAFLQSSKNQLWIAVVLTLLIGRAQAVDAQSTSSEVWPELRVDWRPAAHQRTSLELSSSTERESSKREDSVGLYQDYLFFPLGYVRLGYRFTGSVRDASYRESRIVGELTMLHDLSSLLHLEHRARLEPRLVNGEYSYRIRDRLRLLRGTRPLQKWAFTPYVTAEGYYDSRYRTIARVGGRVGNVSRFSSLGSLDLYIARQNNSRSAPDRVNALGATVTIAF